MNYDVNSSMKTCLYFVSFLTDQNPLFHTFFLINYIFKSLYPKLMFFLVS